MAWIIILISIFKFIAQIKISGSIMGSNQAFEVQSFTKTAMQSLKMYMQEPEREMYVFVLEMLFHFEMEI